MTRIGAVERFVAERKVGDDVAFNRDLQQWPLEPRSIAQVAACDVPVGADAQPDQHIAAKGFDQAKTFATLAARAQRNLHLALRQAAENLVYQQQAL